jgi:hypothetical protein
LKEAQEKFSKEGRPPIPIDDGVYLDPDED